MYLVQALGSLVDVRAEALVPSGLPPAGVAVVGATLGHAAPDRILLVLAFGTSALATARASVPHTLGLGALFLTPGVEGGGGGCRGRGRLIALLIKLEGKIVF